MVQFQLIFTFSHSPPMSDSNAEDEVRRRWRRNADNILKRLTADSSKFTPRVYKWLRRILRCSEAAGSVRRCDNCYFRFDSYFATFYLSILISNKISGCITIILQPKAMKKKSCINHTVSLGACLTTLVL